MIGEGYIDIKRINGNYIIEYFLTQTYNGIKSFGISSGLGENLPELKEYILSLLKKTSEKEVLLKSTKPEDFQERYSELPKRELSQIKRSLSYKRKDITFLIEELSVRKPLRRSPNFHTNIV